MKKKQPGFTKSTHVKFFATVQVCIIFAIILIIAHSFYSFYAIEQKYNIKSQELMFSIVGLAILLIVMIFLCVMNIRVNYDARKYTNFLEENTQGLEHQIIDQWNMLNDKNHDLLSMQESVIEGMATIIEYRDVNTGMHVQKTKRYVQMLTNYLFEHKLHTDEVDERFISIIGNAAAMHDIGKIAISDRILNKPGKFTDEEFEIMKNHTVLGAGIVRQIFEHRIDDDMLRMCIDVVQYHHEKWNGSGYPFGLEGTDIPLSARIMAIADVFDACVSRRVYKDKIPVEEVFEIIKKDAGTHFDPELASIFISMKDDVVSYLDEMNKLAEKKTRESKNTQSSSHISEI
ncbi:MAG: HD domain-containing protein [Treponema sp.]|nr:HD domain-containing protein [Treponema sp.]